MDKIIIPYKPRDKQLDFHKNKKRWNVLVCHRRFGKSVMTINDLIKEAVTSNKERARYAYIAPTYKMAKSIAWDYLKHYVQVIPNIKINESELRIDLFNESRIQLLGADNPDSLRGIYLDGVVLDEYAQMRPNLFTEIIRPALSDRKGYAIFIGTPQGKNHFYQIYKEAEKNDDWYNAIYKASETGYVDINELESAKNMMTEDEYLQEYECSWEAAIIGSYYGKEIRLAREENRICGVPHDPHMKVDTFWDIGFKDDTAIIFTQTFGKEIRIIDAYSNSGLTLADYIDILKAKPYKYDRHFFPWDAKIKPMSSGKSTLEVAREYGLIAETTPNLTVQEGIDRARLLFKNMYFDKDKCNELLNALESYRREYDDKKQTFRANPLHDWSCLTGDTKIRTLKGWIQIKDIKRNDYVWGYSEKEHRLIPVQVKGSALTKRDQEVIEIGLDNGKKIKATHEHLFMMRDESYKRADQLKKGDSLMPFYEQLNRKYIKVDLNDGTFADEHRFVYARLKGKLEDGYHIDHANGDRFDNMPYNLYLLNKENHCSKTFKGKSMEERRHIDKTDNNREFYSRGELYQDCKFCKKEYWGSYKTSYCSKKCAQEMYKKNNSWDARCERDDNYKINALEQGKKRELNRRKICPDCGGLCTRKAQRCKKCADNKKFNHKVRYIKKLKQKYDTYDLYVPETSNFVAEGVVVHNSHFADSFRYMAISIQPIQKTKDDDYMREYSAYINKDIEFNF